MNVEKHPWEGKGNNMITSKWNGSTLTVNSCIGRLRASHYYSIKFC